MKLDPRCRIGLLFLAGLSLFLSDSTLAQLGWLLSLGLAGWALGLPPRRLWRSVRFLRLLIPLTFLLQFFFSLIGNWQGWEAVAWVQLGRTALFYTLRITNLVCLMALAYHWLKLTELVDAIYHLLNPLRRLHWPVDDLFQVIFIALRFFPEVKMHFQQIYSCVRSFSMPPEKLRARLKLVGEVIVPVMIVSFRRADLLAEAMTIRGYPAREQRTYFSQLHWTKYDGLFLAGGVLVTLISLRCL